MRHTWTHVDPMFNPPHQRRRQKRRAMLYKSLTRLARAADIACASAPPLSSSFSVDVLWLENISMNGLRSWFLAASCPIFSTQSTILRSSTVPSELPLLTCKSSSTLQAISSVSLSQLHQLNVVPLLISRTSHLIDLVPRLFNLHE